MHGFLPINSFVSGMDYLGTACAAMGGAVQAGEKGMDFTGSTVLAVVASVGGGTLRDLLAGTLFGGG